MAWARSQGCQNRQVANHSSFTQAFGASVAVGDTINVALQFDTVQGATAAVITDSLGNTYTSQVNDNKAANNSRLQAFHCTVTASGTPTLTIKYNPTPDTTTADGAELSADHFTGSDASSVVEGTPVANQQTAPGTGTDAVTSGNTTPSTNGCLLWSAMYGYGSIGGQTAGTNYTLGISAPEDSLFTEYRTQATAAAAAGVWTVNPGTGATQTLVFAVKPASTGAAVPVFMHHLRQQGIA